MIYTGVGNTQNKDGPTEHKPNYRGVRRVTVRNENVRPSSCAGYVISPASAPRIND